MTRFQREITKNETKVALKHACSQQQIKFISYNGSLELNFEPFMVNGNTVVLNHANQEVGS